MRVGVLVLVMVCLSAGEVKQCSDRKMEVVSKLSKTSVLCPSPVVNISEQKYLLYFNDTLVSQMQLTMRDHSKGLLFNQFEVTVYSSGEYICERDVIYPPPFRKDCHTTVVIVKEKLSSPAVNDTDNAGCPVRAPFIPDMVMWVGSGFLLVYSLSITCIIVIWWKLKRHEEDSNVYVNTRAGDPRKPYKM